MNYMNLDIGETISITLSQTKLHFPFLIVKISEKGGDNGEGLIETPNAKVLLFR